MAIRLIPQLMQNLLQIIEGCYRHDRQSQRALYERYYAYVFRIAFRYLDSYEEAVELTHDTFLGIFRHFSRLRQVGKNNADLYLSEWVKTNMLDAIIQNIKAKTGNYQSECIRESFRFRNQLSPETPALYGELVGTIRELPPVIRAAFNLHVIDGYPQDKIAQLLGIGPETISSYIQKAWQFCLKCLVAEKL
jgi:RNA polymerase sigma factor (sigma-70 family)